MSHRPQRTRIMLIKPINPIITRINHYLVVNSHLLIFKIQSMISNKRKNLVAVINFTWVRDLNVNQTGLQRKTLQQIPSLQPKTL